MRCLTIREPWAKAIMDGLKPVENRTRNVAGAHRGQLVVHVSQTYDGHPSLRRIQLLVPDFKLDLRFAGLIVGVVDLVDVHRPGERPDCQPGALCSPWAEEDRVHLVLADPRRYRYPLRAVGKLGLWEIRDSKLADREFADEVPDHA